MTTTKGGTKDFAEEAEITSPKKTEVKKSKDTSENLEDANKKIDKVCIPYCIFNLSYENHSYIARDRVLTFAVREENEETEVFKTIRSQHPTGIQKLDSKEKRESPSPSEIQFYMFTCRGKFA